MDGELAGSVAEFRWLTLGDGGDGEKVPSAAAGDSFSAFDSSTSISSRSHADVWLPAANASMLDSTPVLPASGTDVAAAR